MDAGLQNIGLWKHNIQGNFPVCWTTAGCYLASFWYGFLLLWPCFPTNISSSAGTVCYIIHLILAHLSCQCQQLHIAANVVMMWTLVLFPSWMNCTAKKLWAVSRPRLFWPSIQRQPSSLASVSRATRFVVRTLRGILKVVLAEKVAAAAHLLPCLGIDLEKLQGCWLSREVVQGSP